MLPAVEAAGAEVRMYKYERPSWTGLLYPTDCYFPTWVIEEDHPVCETLMEAYSGMFGKKARLDKWTFSTNGVAIMGMHGIPCIGFGPGHENQAHAPNEVRPGRGRSWPARRSMPRSRASTHGNTRL